jgi:hypothetical protein
MMRNNFVINELAPNFGWKDLYESPLPNLATWENDGTDIDIIRALAIGRPKPWVERFRKPITECLILDQAGHALNIRRQLANAGCNSGRQRIFSILTCARIDSALNLRGSARIWLLFSGSRKSKRYNLSGLVTN